MTIIFFLIILAITYINYGSNCKPLVNVLITKLEAQAPLVSLKVGLLQIGFNLKILLS